MQFRILRLNIQDMVYFKRKKQKQHLSDIYQNTIDLISEKKKKKKNR